MALQKQTAIKLLQLSTKAYQDGGVLNIEMPGYHYAGQDPDQGEVVKPQNHPALVTFLKDQGLNAAEIVASAAFRGLTSNPETGLTTLEMWTNRVENAATMSYGRARRDLKPGEHVGYVMTKEEALEILRPMANFTTLSEAYVNGHAPRVHVKVPFERGKDYADQVGDALIALGGTSQTVSANNGLGNETAHSVIVEGGIKLMQDAMKQDGIKFRRIGLLSEHAL